MEMSDISSSNSSEDDEEHGGKRIAENNLHSELRSVPFESLVKGSGFAQEDKTSNLPNTNKEGRDSSRRPRKERRGKNEPVEVSSKKTTGKRRFAIAGTTKKSRDPRFASDNETIQQHSVVRENYAFLDGYRIDEMHALEETIKKTRDPLESQKLQKALQSLVKTSNRKAND